MAAARVPHPCGSHLSCVFLFAAVRGIRAADTRGALLLGPESLHARVGYSRNPAPDLPTSSASWSVWKCLGAALHSHVQMHLNIVGVFV